MLCDIEATYIKVYEKCRWKFYLWLYTKTFVLQNFPWFQRSCTKTAPCGRIHFIPCSGTLVTAVYIQKSKLFRAVISLLANGSATSIWKPCCHWLKDLWQVKVTSRILILFPFGPKQIIVWMGCWLSVDTFDDFSWLRWHIASEGLDDLYDLHPWSIN